jgi:hypothetical protein
MKVKERNNRNERNERMMMMMMLTNDTMKVQGLMRCDAMRR